MNEDELVAWFDRYQGASWADLPLRCAVDHAPGPIKVLDAVPGLLAQLRRLRAENEELRARVAR